MQQRNGNRYGNIGYVIDFEWELKIVDHHQLYLILSQRQIQRQRQPSNQKILLSTLFHHAFQLELNSTDQGSK
jgi:hypothetical protein